MKINVMSDLHFEFHQDRGREFIATVSSSFSADVLVLAGDISNASGIGDALSLFGDNFPQIIFCLGNHSMYGGSPVSVERIVARVVSKYSNLHWLDESSTTIDGQRFIGTTLWFADDPRAFPYRRKLNDFYEIKGLVPWVFEKSESAVRFLEREVKSNDVVVTHHLPSQQCVHPAYKGSSLNSFFVRDVEPLIWKRQPKLWIHGHAHESVDLKIGETRILCNPKGYEGYEVNAEFNSALVVEV